jgi:glycyl-tRNA synthetase
MAHYAKDCWDAEVETSYGWIEIAGHADRSCYDLTMHSERTKTELKAAKTLKEAKLVKFIRTVVDKKELGKLFKGDAKLINETFDSLSTEELEKYSKEMEEKGEIVLKVAGGKEFKLIKSLVAFEA